VLRSTEPLIAAALAGDAELAISLVLQLVAMNVPTAERGPAVRAETGPTSPIGGARSRGNGRGRRCGRHCAAPVQLMRLLVVGGQEPADVLEEQEQHDQERAGSERVGGPAPPPSAEDPGGEPDGGGDRCPQHGRPSADLLP
jgi:hypothetical protein